MTDHDLTQPLGEEDSSYARQVRKGFHRLKFSRELESEFREYFLGMHINRVRFALPLAALLTVVFILTDHLRLPIEIVEGTYWTKIGRAHV